MCTRSSCNAIFYHTKSQLTIAQPSIRTLYTITRYSPPFWNVSMSVAHDAYRGYRYSYTYYTKAWTQYTSSVRSRSEFDGKSCYIKSVIENAHQDLLLPRPTKISHLLNQKIELPHSLISNIIISKYRFLLCSFVREFYYSDFYNDFGFIICFHYPMSGSLRLNALNTAEACKM